MKQGAVKVVIGLGVVMMANLLAADGAARGRALLAQETSGVSRAQPAASAPTFDAVAAVISKYHCTVCHGGPEPRAGLSLESYASLMKGSKRGPVVIPGDPAKSELIRRVTGQSEPRMPYTGPPWLTDEEVQMIERWIAAGAPSGKQ
jgi:uncharacterized membrane protein